MDSLKNIFDSSLPATNQIHKTDFLQSRKHIFCRKLIKKYSEIKWIIMVRSKNIFLVIILWLEPPLHLLPLDAFWRWIASTPTFYIIYYVGKSVMNAFCPQKLSRDWAWAWDWGIACFQLARSDDCSCVCRISRLQPIPSPICDSMNLSFGFGLRSEYVFPTSRLVGVLATSCTLFFSPRRSN